MLHYIFLIVLKIEFANHLESRDFTKSIIDINYQEGNKSSGIQGLYLVKHCYRQRNKSSNVALTDLLNI
jgi:hypothetical protein